MTDKRYEPMEEEFIRQMKIVTAISGNGQFTEVHIGTIRYWIKQAERLVQERNEARDWAIKYRDEYEKKTPDTSDTNPPASP